MPDTPKYKFDINTANSGQSVESYLVKVAGLGPRSALKKAFLDKKILVNDLPARRTAKIETADRVTVLDAGLFAATRVSVVTNAKLPLEVLRVTPDFIVISKPGGQHTVPLRPDQDNTALNAIAARFGEASRPMNKPLEGGLIHRLDRGTSGALIAARTPEAFARLRDEWKHRHIEKVYLTWVRGLLTSPTHVSLYLSHDEKSAKRMKAHREKPKTGTSWQAVTEFHPLKSMLGGAGVDPATLLLVRIHTGVMHQIRVTASALGFPVVGDSLYGALKPMHDRPPAKTIAPETAEIFHQLETGPLWEWLRAVERVPLIESLPPHAFFLHSLWLRSSVVQDLSDGVFAPVPGYFG